MLKDGSVPPHSSNRASEIWFLEFLAPRGTHHDACTLEERNEQSVLFLPEDLWLQYIQEELGPLGQPENCSKIHWRAMKFLEGESVERFISKYTLLQTGHWGFQRARRQAEGAARLVRSVLDETGARMRRRCCRFYQSGQLLFILLPPFCISSCLCCMDTRRMLKRV